MLKDKDWKQSSTFLCFKVSKKGKDCIKYLNFMKTTSKAIFPHCFVWEN